MINLEIRFRPILVAALMLAIVEVEAALPSEPRPLTPDDLFRIEEIGEVAYAPDGAEAAIVRRRPATAGRGHGRPLLLGGDRSDVFLVEMGGGEPRPLTSGGAEGAGFWCPIWSPDGRRLAMLSDRGGDNVRLHVWDRGTDEVRQLTEDGVDLWAAVEPATRAPFAWLDDRRLICALVAPGRAHTAFTLDAPTRTGAVEGWARAEAGIEATASVLDTGKGSPATQAASGRLALVDADSGSVATLAEGNCIEALAAPGGRHVAVVVEAGRYKPREGEPLTEFTDRSPSRVGIACTDDPRAVSWVGGIEPKTKIRRVQFTWSADGSQVAVLGKPAPHADRPDALFLVRPDAGIRRIGGDDFRVSQTTRVGEIVLAQGRFGAEGREEWWSIDLSDASRAPKPLTTGLPAVPSTWWNAEPGRALGVAGGKLWRLDAASARCDEVPLMGDRKATRILRPAGPEGGVLVECRPEGGAEVGEFVLVPDDPAGDQAILDRPHPEARLIEGARGAAAVFVAITPDGTSAWTTPGAGRPSSRAFSLNEFLAEVSDAQFRVISYRGADGGSLKAHVLLPPGHKEGDRHPTAVWVYPGTVHSDDRREGLLRKNSPHPMNLVLLAARGYAVLVPSMPLGPEGRAADPLSELAKGVLPAVDKMIELGLADPDRLALIGHSYGGYCVYGLLTQTRRFRAGVAMAGITDLVALHGALDARVRYEPYPFHNLFGPRWTEVGQGRMGASPWTDPDRYRRNSPITYVDRVRTPLLMLHGDADFVPIQQAEAFYIGLLRLGRRARLVRYWGESHVPQSPANIRDLWSQVFTWLDEHLAPAPASGSGSGSARPESEAEVSPPS